MATQRAVYTGVQNIMDGFDSLSQENPFYSVWLNNKDLSFQNVRDDYEAAKQLLEDNLLACEQAGHNEILTIKFHPRPKDEYPYITNKTPIVASVHVRVCPIDLTRRNASDNYAGFEKPATVSKDFEIYEIMSQMKSLPSVMDTRLNALEKKIDEKLLELEELNEIEEMPEVDMIGKITGLVSDERVLNAIGAVIKMFMPNNQPAAIAGVISKPEKKDNLTETPYDLYDEEKFDLIDEQLRILSLHCDLLSDLTLLAKMATDNPGHFNFLLSILRK